ncbi:MAG: S-adenosylmethionine:tRNA ribosyltransferase-isomerase, partial [Acidobacteria bacterium]|nr:S-adenosylmethionine:tRNA ribosyltransferase-isomerase [Acidobacteriota bacterium]
MQLSDYNFTLPGNQIAQQPLDKREASRLLSVDRATGSFSDSLFANFPNLLKSGDLLVLNNTK